MVSQLGLLEAIYAAPERDEPRLVYADWLLERQDPLGELIQLQVAQSRLLRRSSGHTRLGQRIDSLWASGWGAWVPRLKLEPPCDWTFTRGFPTGVHTTAAAFTEHLDDFFAAAPLLDEVELDCGHLGPLALAPLQWLEQLFAAPAFAKVKSLRLQSINDIGAIALSGLPGLAGLSGLELGRSNLGLSTFGVLGSAPSRLLGLTRLELMMANARDAALEQLFEHRWPRLEELAVGNEVVSERGLRAIAERGHLPALKNLDLSWSLSGGPAAVEVLAAAKGVPGLEALDLSHCKVNDAMCEALAAAGGFRLKVLRLAHSKATARGIAALLKSAWFDGLQLLELTGTPLDPRTQATLRVRLGDRVTF